MNKRAFGHEVESRACQFLVDAGLKPLCRNFACRVGEIDLILLDDEVLVFAEVRYRASDRFGGGKCSVTPAKQKRLIKTARLYLQRNQRHCNLPCRFDVIAVKGSAPGMVFDWIKDAFRL